jgi:hypothetical protein
MSVGRSNFEHVIDGAMLPPHGGPSAVDEWLRRSLIDSSPLRVELVFPRSVFVLEGEPHGAGSWRSGARLAGARRAGVVPPEAADPLEPETAGFAGLLEAGAAHLGRAKAAHRAQGRAAAVQARELVLFARQRPAGVLDRPGEEVGAAAVASRAARPAVLTPVSEWAVDEVMVALGLSSAAASRLLTDSITLVQRLPAPPGPARTPSVRHHRSPSPAAAATAANR